jgi:two-component system sensor histidine kinase KdpD
MRSFMARWGDGQYLRAGGMVAVAIGVCLVVRPHLATVDIAMILLLSVVAAAARYRRGPALLACLLSTAAFDYLFVPPYYTFDVFNPSYFLTFGVMLLVALTMSGLTARIREQREIAHEREQQSRALCALEADLAAAEGADALFAAAATHLGRAASASAAIFALARPDDAGEVPLPNVPAFDDPAVRVAATWAWTRGIATGWGTAHGGEVPVMLLPLRAVTGAAGLATIRPADPAIPLSSAQRATVEAMAAAIASALDRHLLAQQNERARADVEAERLRTALLSSLSHDLRTPLAGIETSASTLLDEAAPLPAVTRHELLASILDESRRMTRLIGNLLSMIRVETGMLVVQQLWQPLEEVLGVALLRMEERLKAHPVTTHIPCDLPMVSIDELLIEQVFLNLLENAARYAPAGSPIEIVAQQDGAAVLVEVGDRGPGVPAGEEERVFERFYRGGRAVSADGGAGSGLGLTICRGIITAHGGRIWVAGREGGGAAVRFTLPLIGVPAPAPAELMSC